MRIFGRKKIKKATGAAPKSKSGPRDHIKSTGNGDCFSSSNSSNYSCRFSTDHTFCSNSTPREPLLPQQRPSSIVLKKRIQKPPAQPSYQQHLIESPPRLERTHRSDSSPSTVLLEPMAALSTPHNSKTQHARLGSFVFSTPSGGCRANESPVSSLSYGAGAGTTPSTLESSASAFGWDGDDSPNHYQNYKLLDWFPGPVVLSVLEERHRQADLLRTHSESWNFLLTPAPERLVRQSCAWHLRRHGLQSTIANGTTSSRSRILQEHHATNQYHTSIEYEDKETNSVILQDYSKARKLVHDFVCVGNLDGAIAVAKILLHHQQTKAAQERDAACQILLRQLTLLCLAAGRAPEAADFCTEAQQQKKLNSDDVTEHDVFGLVLFGKNRVGQSIQQWREAVHTAIAVHGYKDHPTVAVLLNSLGVAHLECGDFKAGILALQESVELQRSFLQSSGATPSSGVVVDDSLFALAVTMSNLATACERDRQYDRATECFEESLGLLESSFLPTDDLEDLVQSNLQQLAQVRKGGCDDTCSFTATTTNEEATTVDESTYINDYLSENDEDEDKVPCRRHVSGLSSIDDSRSRSGLGKNNTNKDGRSIASQSCKSNGRSGSLFGNPDGIPSRKLAVKLNMEQRDNHDFLLLGRLSPELSTEQRVRETVMTWFGRRIDGKNAKGEKIDKTESSISVPIISFDLEEAEVDDQHQRDITAASSVVSADFNEGVAVANAAQHLNEIHKQAMKDLDEDRVDQALQLLERALNSHRRKFGEHHHLVGSALHNLGMVNFFDLRYDAALELFEEAIQIRTKSLGPDHPDVQASRVKLALIYFAKGEVGKASEAFRQICKKYVEVLGYGHPQLAKIQNNIGVVAYECGDKEGALQCFETAFEFQHKLLKEQEQCDSPEDHEILSLATANTLTNMAFCYAKRHDFQQAMEMYEHAEEMLRLHLPRRHYRVLDVLQNLNHLVHNCGVDSTFEDELVPATNTSFVRKMDDKCTKRGEWNICGDELGFFSACFC